MNIRIFRKPVLCSTAIVALMAVHGASAAEKAAHDFAIEEITVTARLRSESLQSIPVTENVFTAKMIEQAGIQQVDDVVGLIPNVTMVNSQDSGTSFISIRGLTQVRNSKSPVALVIDGVLAASPLQLTQELFDVKQIEVLKGPQGALYGRNAIGGVITITTKQPTNEFEGFIRGGAGNGKRIKVQGSISGPIVKDKVLFRASASQVQTDGYLNNIFLKEKADWTRDRAARLLLKIKPSDNVTIDLRGGMSDTEGGALNFVINSDLYVGGPDFFGDPNNASVPIRANVRGIDNRELRDVSAKIDIDLDYGRITSISAYNYVFERSAGDSAPYSSTAADGTQDGDIKNKAYSQELRFTSPADKRFRYIVGGYYLHRNRNALLTIGVDDGAGVLVPGINGPTTINPPNSPNQTLYAAWDDTISNAYAAFVQLAFDITPELELAGAMRYDRDHRKQTDLSPFSPNQGDVRKATFDKWQPKVTLTYKPTDNLTVYANYAQGFRSGGFNAPGVAAIAAVATPPLAGVKDIYGEETSTTYEAGVKSRWADDRLTLNAAVFKTNDKGQQYFSFLSALNAQIITSIDKVDLQGFEIEANYRPVDGLDLFASYGYTKSKIKAYAVDPTAVGNWAPYVPRDTINLGAQYHKLVTGNVSVLARVDYQRLGKQYWEVNNIAPRDPVGLVNARFGFDDDAHGWSVMAWVKNLTDKIYNAEFVAGGFVQQALPRTWGVDFTKRF